MASDNSGSQQTRLNVKRWIRTGPLRRVRSLAASLTLLPIAVAQQLRRFAGRPCSVSSSCQIPDLPSKFRDIGLSAERGVFVEIGGFDGESYSNTSFLADQGWRGLYVEPIPRFCQKIHVRHMFNRVAIAQCAVTSEVGELVIKDMGSISTSRDSFVDAHKEFGWAREAIDQAIDTLVQTVPLFDLLDRHDIPHNFELLVIDVEGSELPIVEALFASPWRPRVLIVELIDENPEFAGNDVAADHRTIRQMIGDNGYGTFFQDALNSIFVAYTRH